MSKRPMILMSCLAAMFVAALAQARSIPLSNEDGIVAANLRARKLRLSEAGQRATVAAPIDNQSGRGSTSAP